MSVAVQFGSDFVPPVAGELLLDSVSELQRKCVLDPVCAHFGQSDLGVPQQYSFVQELWSSLVDSYESAEMKTPSGIQSMRNCSQFGRVLSGRPVYCGDRHACPWCHGRSVVAELCSSVLHAVGLIRQLEKSSPCRSVKLIAIDFDVGAETPEVFVRNCLKQNPSVLGKKGIYGTYRLASLRPKLETVRYGLKLVSLLSSSVDVSKHAAGLLGEVELSDSLECDEKLAHLVSLVCRYDPWRLDLRTSSRYLPAVVACDAQAYGKLSSSTGLLRNRKHRQILSRITIRSVLKGSDGKEEEE